ncbi:hydroxymethylglutaryl-CoA lyase [Bacillus sp. Marseille-P3661]|uniref:hydroxymethylglutaryl-CoA lyase n=1 Tax=Bacillus sp. Marseille-P3661 TaxID=1936234 RepID=UPI000C866A77|nr:hydroxymethylglutaryl-CoA lyase [Bacillus sp. Marseille-P3661]
MKLPNKVEIVEVGPRDGLQNEKKFINTENKVKLINLLSETGIERMEATSFVHPKHVPQMADASEVIQNIEMKKQIQYMALIPNEKGYLRAVDNGISALSLVVGASNTFNEKNVRMSRQQSMEVLKDVILQAKQNNIFIRYNISTAFWCPFEGETEKDIVHEMVQSVDALGVEELTICDTIGKANPKQVYDLFQEIVKLPLKAKITAHFHDTYGMAQANVIAALEAGVTSFDAAVGGLGGCPFAPGAAGNLATEDLVFMLHEMGIETGINLEKLLECVAFVKPLTDRNLTGHLYKALNG